jgi:mono/diheme cytochrome c family protein
VARRTAFLLFLAFAFTPLTRADDSRPADRVAAARGYRLLLEKAYLPYDFDQETFDELWKCWPEPLRSQAEQASPEERRKLAFSRYGLTPRPDDPTKPLQYVVDARGRWIMNCFACHGGKVAGQVIPGLPNSHYALMTLTDDVRTTKLALEKPPARMELGSLFMPLGTTNGTTNAVNFGVALMGFRDKDLNFIERLPPKMLHHDMDAPAWWHFSKKKNLYIDGFATKGHRGLMQFMLVRSNGPESFKEWESDFRDVYAYLSSLKPPKYPYAIDHVAAKRGEATFSKHCAECHGTYGEQPEYPERMVPIAEIGTDRARYDSLSPPHRRAYGDSWFNHYGKLGNIDDPSGYVAPPLDGVWASAPYFHNGSVPTLWHVLHPEDRPGLWKRTEDGYDQQRIGLDVSVAAELPEGLSAAELRTWFDTRPLGKSARGHDFPAKLTEAERADVLEYLKTL